MTKIITLMAITASITILSASEDQASLVLNFAKKQLPKAHIEYKNMQITSDKKINKQWQAITVSFEARQQGSKAEFEKKDNTFFMNGSYLVGDSLNLKTGKSLLEEMAKDFSSSDYRDSRLVFGDSSAKNKIVVFSDPLCPFCKERISDFKEKVGDRKDIALYIYEIPLRRIHPSSELIIKHIMASQNPRKTTVQVYTADIPNNVKTSTDFKTVNKWFKDATGEDLQEKDVLSDSIAKELSKNEALAEKVGARGTPYIFLNGKYIKGDAEIKKILKNKQVK